MPRPRHSHLLIPVAAAALVVGSCGDANGGNPTRSDVTAAATVAVRVIDGDTRRPLAGAAVTGVSANVAGQTVPADPGGEAIIPSEGVDGVCAEIPTHFKDCRTLLPGRTTLTIPLYNPNLQSPEYGGGPARTRYVPAVNVPPPSGKPAWTHTGKALLEFPPAVSRGTVVLTTNRGRVFARDARTGAIKWDVRHTTNNNIASTPAITPDGTQAIVSGMDGRLVAYSMASGEIVWQTDAGRSPIESSPLIVGNTVYVGAHNGIIYAVDIPGPPGRRTARQIFQADDDVKSSLALAGDDRLIFGDYSGNVYAIRVGTGERLWKANHGQKFYGGAAISRGIAVLGDVGGGVVAINVTNGRRIWRKPTGIVYASPAIARNTVYIGSYDENFYAIDLESGDEKWAFDAGGRVGGSATVVGNTVYFSILARAGERGRDRTYGLNVANGAERFRLDDGRYSAGVAAGRTLYLVGRTNMYAYPAP